VAGGLPTDSKPGFLFTHLQSTIEIFDENTEGHDMGEIGI
jgi:hypothetical protein